MNQGIRTIISPVKEIAQTKEFYRVLLEVEPYLDQPYYVGFRIADTEIGLDPNGHKHGTTAYYDVDDIKGKLQALVQAGAQIEQDTRDVGGGMLTAIARDPNGNLIGLRQKPV